jgi:hypothetical protein
MRKPSLSAGGSEGRNKPCFLLRAHYRCADVFHLVPERTGEDKRQTGESEEKILITEKDGLN